MSGQSRVRKEGTVAKDGLGELRAGTEKGWETSPLRKLCAHSKDRFKVYGRRIIPFIVLVNPGIYTPRRSSPTPLLRGAHTAAHLSCVGKPGWCFNPFPFYERLLRARLAGPFAPICRFWKRAGCLPAAETHRASRK